MTHNEDLDHGSFVNPPMMAHSFMFCLAVPILIHSPSCSLLSVFTQDIIIFLRKKLLSFFFKHYFVKNLYSLEELLLCRCAGWMGTQLQKSDDTRSMKRKTERNCSANKIIHFWYPKSFSCLNKYYTKRNK